MPESRLEANKNSRVCRPLTVTYEYSKFLLDYRDIPARRLNHYIFRYPAKFHPRVAGKLVEEYTAPGDTLLDPFCGSGTVLVEAAIRNRNIVGSDIDPLATLVADVKSQTYSEDELLHVVNSVESEITKRERTPTEYDKLTNSDISYQELVAEAEAYHNKLPMIPNMFHWFKHYICADLLAIYEIIDRVNVKNEHRKFLLVCFASIIRACSNADPVPVSGLEVTSHMKRKLSLGRRLNPFEIFRRALDTHSKAVVEFTNAVAARFTRSIFDLDVAELSQKTEARFDAIITSPPYLSAVDYYRRHTLETFWLGLTKSHADRLTIMPKYIGRDRVANKHVTKDLIYSLPLSVRMKIDEIAWDRPEKKNALIQYFATIREGLIGLSKNLRVHDSPVILVLGANTFNGRYVDTPFLVAECIDDHLKIEKDFTYKLENRYMSYTRRNGADIAQEHVLVLKQRG